MASIKDSYVRHEFVVNPERHPLVAAFIQDPKNSGKVGGLIVALLEAYLWAAKNVSGGSLMDLIGQLQSLSARTNRLLAMVEGGTNNDKKPKKSGPESHKGALDSL